MKEKKTKRRVWRGVATTGTSLLALSLSASMVIDTFRTDIDKFLGTQSTQMVTDNQTEDDYTYKSDYSSTTELLDSIEDLGERMSEEGTVLLKNNGALPLSADEKKKVTFLDSPVISQSKVEISEVLLLRIKEQMPIPWIWYRRLRRRDIV